MASPTDPPRPADLLRLVVVRLAILLGVLMFGGVVWFVRSRPGFTPAPAPDPGVLRYAGLGAWALAAAGLLLVRARWRREPDPARRAPLLIAAWALGEVPALWGGVRYLLTGDPQWFFTGLTFLVLIFLLFPIPGPR